MFYRINGSNTSTYAVSSLANVNRRDMLRLRVRAFRKRLLGTLIVSGGRVREPVRERVAERGAGQSAVTS